MAQRTKTEQYCKNHQKELGTFFLAEQPWVKFCSQCALNMALCGKKIDKDLTAEQYDNKTQVLSILQRMKNTLTKILPSKKIMDEIVTKIENGSKSQISRCIKDFDEYVRNLCQIRDQVIHFFQQGFLHNIQAYFQKQTKILLFQIQLKDNLSYIQANYRTIIQNKEEVPMGQQIQHWNALLADINKILPTQDQAIDVQQTIFTKMDLLYQKLSSIQPFKVSITEMCKRKTMESKITEAPGSYESVNLSQKKENGRRTQLKLRSRSKQSDKRSERETFKTRKSIRDISNFQMMESFQI